MGVATIMSRILFRHFIFMAETLLTIQEVAAITGKSLQTIRRAIKARKLISKRKKTPQGFNYLITQDSVASFYKVDTKALNRDREQGSLNVKEKSVSTDTTSAFATLSDLQAMEKEVADLLEEYKKEKESFMRFMKAFQERFVVLENQLKLLEQPKKKSWYQFWK